MLGVVTFEASVCGCAVHFCNIHVVEGGSFGANRCILKGKPATSDSNSIKDWVIGKEEEVFWGDKNLVLMPLLVEGVSVRSMFVCM